MVILETSMGDIHINLFTDKAPITSENFINYVKQNFYNGTIFHRVIDGFMIQCGGFDENMQEKSSNGTIENEAKNGLHNKKYTIAMARTNAPHSASSQFFINVADNKFLDYPGQDGWGYCVFGEVAEGQGVVDKIKKVITINFAGHSDVPKDTITINKAYIV